MKKVLTGGAAAMVAVLVFGGGWGARTARGAAQNAAQAPAEQSAAQAPAQNAAQAPSQSAAQSAAQTQRVAQFENEDVKVWKSLVLPNQPLTMHRHDHPRVIIALKGGTMKIVEQDGGVGNACLGDGEGVLAAGQRTEYQARGRECRRGAD